VVHCTYSALLCNYTPRITHTAPSCAMHLTPKHEMTAALAHAQCTQDEPNQATADQAQIRLLPTIHHGGKRRHSQPSKLANTIGSPLLPARAFEAHSKRRLLRFALLPPRDSQLTSPARLAGFARRRFAPPQHIAQHTAYPSVSSTRSQVPRILHALTSTVYGSDRGLTGAHVLPWADPDFNWDYWTNWDPEPLPPGPAPPKLPNYEN
jgi:hypothetical protein